MRILATALLVLAAAATPALAAPASSKNLDKVLVIGTDGTRWDLTKAAMKSGRAPNLARLARRGFARPAILKYGPNVLTLSEVGWSSIASGVWPDKHGVDGRKFNMDPKQATKNGYLDFLTRVENAEPRLNTYLASDWANIGLAMNGGPIFGPTDERFAISTDVETLEQWNAGDVKVTDAATRELRRGDPDASFVYLGLVDETAHLVGSALPAYATSISTTDARIGQIIRAVRSRPSYPFESWTILVTTDHGQRALTEPSPVSHLSQTPLEITAFVIGAGPGLGRKVRKPVVVDIAPTVLHQLGLPVKPSWNLDGHSLSSAPDSSYASVAVKRGRLSASLRLGTPPAGARTLRLQLPAGVKAKGALAVRVNGRPAFARRLGKRTVVVYLGHARLRRLALETGVSVTGHNAARSATFTLRGRKGALGRLSVSVSGA